MGELAYWSGLERGEERLRELGCSREGQAGGMWVQPLVPTAGWWQRMELAAPSSWAAAPD